MPADPTRGTRNRLATQTSPYLLQHADNPVDWYPWGAEALAKARAEDKPILLSIGYSACHWCHVMAHESFEDPATAAAMNALFVNIKVDREERPDLDKIYQTAHQLIIGRGGGWPLTLFLAPDDLTPFFGGTYFPVKPRHGLPGFADLAQRVMDFYRDNRAEIDKQNLSLREALTSLAQGGGNAQTLSNAPLDTARRQMAEHYDARHGGFGTVPKFPHPTTIEVLLRRWAASRGENEDHDALAMARTTLHAMATGGIYDQIGGGFCRYSVDERWMIPHFEKMLYDNGPLLALYAHAWHATGDSALQRVALEVGAWAMREMQSPEGGYYCTLDADSEGEEGKFYVWTPPQVQALLTDAEYRILAPHYGLDRPANFEDAWHLYVARSLETVAEKAQLPLAEAQALLASARRKLFDARRQRARPGRDEKVLVAWNALMIKGMAVAGRVLGQADLLRSAERAVEFIRTHMYRDGRLLATYTDGHAHLNAYLDDYAFLIDALIELLQARWRDADMALAVALADTLLEQFEDRERGGFFFTSHDHEQLIQRPKPMADDATPAGNGSAAYVMGRLGHLLGEPRYLDAAQRTLLAGAHEMTQMPYAYGALLLALEEHTDALETVIVRCPEDACGRWREGAAYAPRRLLLCIPPDARTLPGALAQRVMHGDGVAYVCHGQTCSTPLDSPATLAAVLRGVEAADAPHARH